MSETLIFGHYQEIKTLPEKSPRTWTGLDNFESNSDIFIFGYASLNSPSSVSATLGRTMDPNTFCYAKLNGWARSWCVGSDKTSHPERTFYFPDGSAYEGLTVVLGIEPSRHAECDGGVFPISRSDLTLLDVRERNYRRIDVSPHVTWAGKPANCTVYTYVPLSEATARIADAVKSGRKVNIRRSYIDLVQQAFAELGQPGPRKEWTEPPYVIEDMHVRIDPGLAPTKALLDSASYLQNTSPSSDDVAPGGCVDDQQV